MVLKHTRQPQGLGANLLTGQIYAENCMKMKEIGRRRGAHPLAFLKRNG